MSRQRKSGSVRVGLAGWDYPDWNGIVYPRRAGRGFDKLAWIARFVDSIEALERSTSSVGYVRLHGRNTEQWFRKGAGRDERYDYLYSLSELAPLVRTANGLAEQTAEVFVVQNNHFRGQALVNALHLKHLFTGQRPKCPQGLVETYPDLEPLVDVERETLF